MARLQWNDVRAPDFGEALQGIRDFGNTIGNAFGGLNKSVGEFDQAQSDKVNAALAMQLLQEQDPTVLRDKLASGSFLEGVDPRRVSAATLAQIGARPTQLLAQNAGFRADAQAVAEDKAAPIIGQIADLERMGKHAEAAALRNANPGLYAGLGLDKVLGVNKDLQGIEKGQVDITGAKQDQTIAWNREGRDQKEFSFKVEDRNDLKNGQAAYLDAMSMSSSPEDALAAFSSGRYANLSPGAKMYALQQLNGSWGNIYAPSQLAGVAGIPTGGSSGGGSSNFIFGDPQKSVAEALSAGGLPPAVVAGFLGNFHVEGGYSGQRGDGGKAAGIAQWHPDRQAMFQQVIGKPVGQASHAEQAKFVLWEMQNPGKAGMTVQQRDRIMAAKTPGEAAALIDQFYERSSGQHRQSRIDTALSVYTGLADKASVLTDARVGQNSTTSPAAADVIALQNDKTPIGDVADKLLAGPFKGTSRKFILDQLTRVASNGKTSYAHAGDILARNIRGADSGGERILRGIEQWLPDNWHPFGGSLTRTSNLPNGQRLNDAKIAEEIAKTARGQTRETALTNLSGQQLSQQIQGAKAQLQAAVNAEMAMRQRAQVQPNLAAQLPRLQERSRQAQALLESYLLQYERNKDVVGPDVTSTRKPAASVGQMLSDILSGDFLTVRRGKPTN